MQSSYLKNTPNTSLDQALQAMLNSKSDNIWDNISFERNKIWDGLDIIRKGANPGIAGENGNNIFHLIFSLRELSYNILCELQTHPLFNFNQVYDKNKAGISPFQYAMQYTRFDCITMILQLTKGRDREIETEAYQSLLDCWAIEDKKKLKILIALIKAGVNPNTPNKDGDTILHLLVITNGRFNGLVVDLVKHYGANLAKVNRFGLTPLQLLLTKHPLVKKEAVASYAETLFELGESVNADMDSQLETFESMLREYSKKDEDGNNIFHQLLLSVPEPAEKMNELMAHPFFKPEMGYAKNHAGFSPLQYAVQNKQIDCVESILKRILPKINVCDVFDVFQPLLEDKTEDDQRILVSFIKEYVTFNLHNNSDHIIYLLEGKNADGQFNELLDNFIKKLEQKKIARAHQAYLYAIKMTDVHSLGAFLIKYGDQYHQILGFLNTCYITDKGGDRFYWQQYDPAESDIQELTANPVPFPDENRFPGISFFEGPNKLLTKEEEKLPSMKQGQVFRLFKRHPFTLEMTTQMQKPARQPGKGYDG